MTNKFHFKKFNIVMKIDKDIVSYTLVYVYQLNHNRTPPPPPKPPLAPLDNVQCDHMTVLFSTESPVYKTTHRQESKRCMRLCARVNPPKYWPLESHARIARVCPPPK